MKNAEFDQNESAHHISEPEEPGLGSERKEPLTRVDEIDKEQAVKRARIEEIRGRAPAPDFMIDEEVEEIQRLVEEISLLESEKSSLLLKYKRLI